MRTRIAAGLAALLLAATCSTPSDPAPQPAEHSAAPSVAPPPVAPPTAPLRDVVAAPTSTARPKAQPGFQVDLVAEAPAILWPSAILALDDGSILVGEDRMDMPGPTDQPLDRVIRLAWDADGTLTKTAFASGLYAVMGLEQQDGDVFVMNMPHLTRLRDRDGDGVAEEREEILTNLGPPAPGWPGGFNDHIVSGLHFGIDGRLYVAVGDKGIPGAAGRDGSRIELRGGGVVRLRPDGTELEIVARGLRNVLDVAIDADGEMFTYDNTDDGLGWWTRATHIVPGGQFGYPWDYTRRPERTLPCMKDYGGGSPCGGLVYREAAWPAPYRGSWFHCEWGKGSLRRFELERAGSSFRIAKDEDFVTAGDVKSFRPFDVCESPDGRFLYVSDWANDGWTNPTECGRIWRVRRADDDARRPSVARPLPATTSELVAALDDPSYRQRTRAQRALARSTSAKDLAILLHAAGGSSALVPRTHALWALDEILRRADPAAADASARERTLSDIAAGPAASVPLARWLGSAGADERSALSRLLAFLKDGDPFVRRTAAESLALRLPAWRGEIEAYGCVDALLDALEHAEDRYERFAIVQALRASGATPEILGASARTQLDLIEVLRENRTEACVAMLARVVREADDESLRLRALVALADTAREPAPWDGKWWNIQPAARPPPAHTVDWAGTELALAGVRAALEDEAAAVRLAALAAIVEAEDRDGAPAIRDRFARETEESVRVAALDALGSLRDPDALALIETVLRSGPRSDDERTHAVGAATRIATPEAIGLVVAIARDERALDAQVVPCLAALGRRTEPGALAAIEQRLHAGSSAVRAAAVAAFVEARGKAGAATLEPLLADLDAAVRRAACAALGSIGGREHVPSILPLVDDDATRSAATAALARTPDARALDAYLRGLALPDNGLRLACQGAISAIRAECRATIEARHAASPLAPDVLEQVRAIYAEPQAVHAWRIVGPLPREKDAAPRIDPLRVDVASAVAGIDGRATPWIELFARADGFVDLEKTLQPASNVEAWAFATLTSARARTAQFRLGSDDTCTVWVNGVERHDFQGDRAFTADSDRFDAPLVAGANAILVRIGNSGGHWSFALKASEEPGGPLFDGEVPAAGSAHRAFARTHPGDPARGSIVFRRADGPQCIRCHVVDGAGTAVGPDLSDVALKYPRDELVDSVLEPSKRVAEGYTTLALELDDGLVAVGMLKAETKDAIELWDSTGQVRRIDPGEVVGRRTIPMSVMPDGLATLVSPEEFADLVAYLQSLKGTAAK